MFYATHYQSMLFSSFITSVLDKKLQNGEWHPHHQWNSTRETAARSGPLQLKHHEYQTTKGVPFPAATGNAYNAIFFLDP